MKDSVLFKNMTEAEIEKCLKTLNTSEKLYKKDALILSAGYPTERFGMVLSGSATVETNDVWGSKTILSHIGAGQFFAETYALLTDEPLLVDVRANENCRIKFFSVGNIEKIKSLTEPWAMKFVCNMLEISARKNIALSTRSFHISHKTIRERVLSYLNTVSLQKRSTEFDIPFDRQQLADYLNVDRSALSNELSKLQKDGVIRCRKNHFFLPLFFLPRL